MDDRKLPVEMNTTNQFASLWQEALAAYEKTSERPLSEINQTGQNMRTVDDLRNLIEQTDKNFSSFRNRHAIWGYLEVMMAPVQMLGQLSQSAIGLSPIAPASTILSAALYLLSAAGGVSATYDAIEALLGDVGDVTKRIEVHSQASIDPSLWEILIKIVCTILEILARAEKLAKRRRIVEFASTTFLGKDEKVQGFLSELKKLTENETQMVIALVNQTTRRIERNGELISITTGKIENSVQKIEEQINESRNEAKEKEDQDEVVKLLGSSMILEKTYELFESINKKRMSESGTWLLQDPRFRKWEKREAPFLWVFGEPGTGKTFLSSKIIDYLQSDGMVANSFVAYFFIKEDTRESTSADNILRSIALQIAQNDRAFRQFLLKVSRNSPMDLRNTAKFWKSVFLGFFESSECCASAFIVLDGVDEAPRDTRETLIELFHDLEKLRTSVQRPRIQLAIISRVELQNDILKFTYWGQFVDHINVSANRNSADIERYIKQEVPKVQILRSKRLTTKDKNDLKQMILKKLEEGANGMFQWVKLVLAEIALKKVRSDITHALNTVPKDLLEMVGHVLDRVAQDLDVPQDYFQEMLRWIACVKRPLSLGELEEVLKTMNRDVGKQPSTDDETDLDDGESVSGDWKNWPEFETDLRTTFGSFIILTRADGKTTETLQSEYNADKSRDGNSEDEHHEYSNDSEELQDDDEWPTDLPEFNSNRETTQVQFTHASIRDFLFRQEGLMREFVRIDKNTTSAHIVTRCLAHFANDPTIDATGASIHYATEHWVDHLDEVDQTKLPVEDRVRILKLLFRILHDPEPAHSFFTNQVQYFMENFAHMSQTALSTVNKWSTEEVTRVLSDEENAWLSEARTSTSNLFRCVAREICRKWLTTWDHLHPYHFHYSLEFLHNCGLIKDDGPPAVEGQTATFQGPIFSIETIRKFAQAFNFEEDSTWHARLGWTFSIYEHLEAACEEFNRALALDSQDCRIHMHLAEAYAKQQKLESAIETSLTALKFCTIDREDARIALWEHIRNWRFELDDDAGTIEAAKEASSKQWSPYGTMINFDYLYKLRQYHLIMDLAKALDKSTIPQRDETRLDELLTTDTLDASRLLGYVASAIGEIDYMDEILERVISNSRRYNDILRERKLRTAYAHFVKTIRQDESKALKLLQDLTSEYLTSPPATGFFKYDDEECRSASYALLIQLYLCKALHDTTSDSLGFATELQSLLERLSVLQAQPAEKKIYDNQGSLAMGTWHRIQSQPEQAKTWLRKRVLEGIKKLSGTTGGWYYLELADALLCFGDKQNALIAFAAAAVTSDAFKDIRQPEEKGNTSEPNPTNDHPHPDDTKQNQPYNIPLECGGQCGHKSSTFTAFFLCEYCYSTGFCDQCAKLVKGSRLRFLVCDSSHPLLQIYSLDVELAKLGASLGDDGQIQPREEWLESLLQEWT